MFLPLAVVEPNHIFFLFLVTAFFTNRERSGAEVLADGTHHLRSSAGAAWLGGSDTRDWEGGSARQGAAGDSVVVVSLTLRHRP